MHKNILVVLGLTLSSLSVVCAKDIPNPPSNYVLDEPHLLSAATVQEVSSELRDVDTKDGRQIVVAIINSLEGENVEDFTNRMARQWKVGQKGKDNGVVLAIYWKDGKIRLEVGYGLEQYLTDAKSKDITSAMKGHLRNNPDAVIRQAVKSIIAVSTTPAAESVTTEQKASSPQVDPTILITLVLSVVLIMVCGTAYTSYRRKKEAEKGAESQRQLRLREIEKQKVYLKSIYPDLSFEKAKIKYARVQEEEQRKEYERERQARIAEQKAAEEAEQDRIKKKYRVGFNGMTLATALALEEAEQERRREEDRKLRRKHEEEEEKRRRDDDDNSGSGSLSSSGGGGFDFGGFSGGGGDFGGGGSTDSF